MIMAHQVEKTVNPQMHQMIVECLAIPVRLVADRFETRWRSLPAPTRSTSIPGLVTPFGKESTFVGVGLPRN